MTSPEPAAEPVANSSTTIELEIVHGDLRLHDAAIIVGHLDGTSFDGAEWALDDAARGLLTHSDRLGVYVGLPGSVALRRLKPVNGPPWAVTIGMGEIGEFNTSILRRGISEACLRLAMASYDADATEPVRVRVAPVLIGAGTGGTSVDDSLGAIVNGVFDANRRLATTELFDKVRIVKIDIIDIFEETAIQAHRAAMELQKRFLHRADEDLIVAKFVKTGPGGRPGVAAPSYRDGQWRTVTVQAIELATGPGEPLPGTEPLVDLMFTAVGGRARVEEALTTTQRNQINLLIAGAVDSPDDTEQGHNTLYELLLPPTLKASLEQPGNLMFVLDPEAAPYPWELLAPRLRGSGIEPLASQAGLLRRLRTTEFRQAPRSSAGATALVIGDPPSRFPVLAGAQQEANRVADVLEAAGWKVTRVISGGKEAIDANRVLNALFAEDYRVVHIAAHGVYDPARPTQSGVVIGDDRFLTSLEFAAMSSVPEFVFLNCCHLAKIDAVPPGGARAGALGQFHRLAASVSQQLIENGVRAVAAAGWAVDDDAALEFAEELYRGLLRGVGFGDAVRQARWSVRDHYRGLSNTWGAYQCYGPPAFKLGYAPNEIEPDTDPASPGDLATRLHKLVWHAEFAEEDEDVDKVADQVKRLLAAVPEGFVGGEQLHTAGIVYRHLGRLDEALESLTTARRYLGVRAPLSLVQHLVSASLSAAGDSLREGDPVAAQIFMQQADDHMANIERVIGDAEDAVVWRLRAECALRRALVEQHVTPHGGKATPFDPSELLTAAESDYRSVFDLAAKGGEVDFRAGFDVHFCRIMLNLAPLDADAPVASLAVAAETERTREAWKVWAEAYQALADALPAPGTSFEGDASHVVALFQDAHQECRSRRERQGVRDHLEVLAAFTGGDRATIVGQLLEELFGATTRNAEPNKPDARHPASA